MLGEDTRQTDSEEDSIDKPCARNARLSQLSHPNPSLHSQKKITRLVSANDSPMIKEKRLQINHELLLGQNVKRYFTGYGSAVGTVKKYSLNQDAYYLTYTNGHHE